MDWRNDTTELGLLFNGIVSDSYGGIKLLSWFKRYIWKIAKDVCAYSN